jgi:hypothetical protein
MARLARDGASRRARGDKAPADAVDAMRKYHGMTGDAGTLGMELFGAQVSSLVARLGGGASILDSPVYAVLADEAAGRACLFVRSGAGGKADGMCRKTRSNTLVNEPGLIPSAYTGSCRIHLSAIEIRDLAYAWTCCSFES